MQDTPPEDESTTNGDDPSPTVERRWRPASELSLRPDSSDTEAPPEQPAPSADEGRGGEAPPRGEQAPDAPDGPPRPATEAPPAGEGAPDGRPSPDAPMDADASPPSAPPTEPSPDATPNRAASPADAGDGSGPEDSAPPDPADAEDGDPLDPSDSPNDLPESPSDAGLPDDGAEADPPPDLDEIREAGKQVNEEAFADDADERSWADQMQDESDASREQLSSPPGDEQESFFTDEHRYVPGAEQVEEELQDFAYDINEGTADTDWTPSKQEDHRIAAMFARLVSKVAEDMSYQRTPGDEFWDPRKIMRRQIDRRPLRHCKMEYTKRRLALLVDTSPSCRDEAVFYSKIATGALLRDDIDIFLCPNGRIDAQFDPEPMRFVDDDRGSEWDLEGRVVLYFTDWDGTDEIVEHSRNCTLYWFDNCAPSDYWESTKERHQRVRLRYRGQHFHCPDPDAFRRLARKIRP